ncbi:MAG TPA: hypothetical protein VLC50_04130 [Actinomycetes bacterium]|nr:hypothetical protein [Actinomycetes bacterium]
MVERDFTAVDPDDAALAPEPEPVAPDEEPVSSDEHHDPLADLEAPPPDEVNPADLVEQRRVVPLDEDDYR